MIAVDYKKFVQEYWDAISGKPKPVSLLEKYISDSEFIGHVVAYEKSFPCYELIADDFICEEDKVVVRARVIGTHKGDLMGIPPTGRTIDIPFSVIYQIKDEKIAKGWLYLDQMILMEQLGITSKN
ncbi:MAG: hypothetical protein HKN52_06825 [Eudoraea sp.]|nr:hypothetical protein [Eudoraea sp.]